MTLHFLPLFPLFLASAMAFLEARQYLQCGPHPIYCGGGYCCEQYYLCKPNGSSYLCVDTLLTLSDGTQDVYTALNAASDNAVYSSLGITLSTVLTSVPATTTTASLGATGQNLPSNTGVTAASATTATAAKPSSAVGRIYGRDRVGMVIGFVMVMVMVMI